MFPKEPTIVSHMTGRQLQRWPGYEIDVEKVLRACAKHDVVVEINAHPWRAIGKDGVSHFQLLGWSSITAYDRMYFRTGQCQAGR